MALWFSMTDRSFYTLKEYIRADGVRTFEAELPDSGLKNPKNAWLELQTTITGMILYTFE